MPMKRRIMQWGLVAAMGSAALLHAGAAAAQPSPETRTTAVTLFDEARKLMTAGKYAEACPKLEESQRLDPGVGTLYNLSDCHEHVGRTASAWTGFREVAASSAASKQLEREKAARARVATLEPKLTRLRIVVQAAPGIEVTRNGVVVGAPSYGVGIPVDPGKYTVRATAPGKEPWQTAVSVEGEGAVVNVEVPALVDSSTPAVPPTVPSTSPSTPAPNAVTAPPPITPPPPDTTKPSSRGWQTPLGVVALGLGVAGLGVGTALGFVAKSTAEDAECNDNDECTQAGLDTRSDARAQGDIGTGVFIAGAALAVGGVILLITAPSSGDADADAGKKSAARSRPPARAVRVGVAPSGVVVQGTW
jgi:serine/threonine-protein kinase